MSIRSHGLCAVLVLLSACAETVPGPVLSSGDRYVRPETAVAEYRLDVGDEIKLTVYNEPALSGRFNVNADGSVSLPLIGDVPARGQTVAAVALAAQARLADGFLRQPQVSAEVVTYRPFYILGEVATPGSYPYAVGMTAMGAVAMAKGFTPRANKDVVRIRRQGETEETNYRLTSDLHIAPGDTIRVGERFF